MKKLLFVLLCSISIGLYAQDNTLTSKEKKKGWKLLFDGKNMAGWKGAFIEKFPEKGWSISEGILSVEAAQGKESTNGGDIVTLDLYDNFELMVDFKLTTGANSGIKYFVFPEQTATKDPRSAIGLEFQVLDDAVHPDAKMGRDGNRTIGSLYDLIPAASNKKVNPIGEWNTARIVSKGKHVEHWLNGKKVLQYERGSDMFKQLVAMSKYKSIAEFGVIEKGRILLQDHGDKVSYKNIKIRLLKS